MTMTEKIAGFFKPGTVQLHALIIVAGIVGYDILSDDSGGSGWVISMKKPSSRTGLAINRILGAKFAVQIPQNLRVIMPAS